MSRILIMGYIFSCNMYAVAETLPSCPWHVQPQCKGPYVIRPSATRPQCHADHQSAMMSCMQQCQADVCCRAFGLDAAGTCVTSNTTTEALHFVKESNEPNPETCEYAKQKSEYISFCDYITRINICFILSASELGKGVRV